jgi:asparagine synthase (glutamine-hydrolysing)
MCGICGLFGTGRPVEEGRRIVSGMMKALAHRGPDSEGRAEGRSVLLGHRRLSIIDVALGAQPMLSADRRFALTFNGEIYNYLELRSELEREGVSFRTASDTEVLLEALIRHGEKALTRLNGMFAFAFCDLESGEWMLARDPFGIKPLYLAEFGQEIGFASEIKAFLAHPDFRPALDHEALSEYLTFQFTLSERTLFSGVRKIEPGTCVKGRGVRVRSVVRYWEFDFESPLYTSMDESVADLRAALESSARRQIRSDVPIGVYLSGGLDSTTIASLARKATGRRIPAFHGRFDEGDAFDELAFAREASSALDLELIVSTPGPSDFIDLMPGLVRAMDEPAAGPGLFPHYFVSRAAQKHVKVVLGGQGGDELFGGYARHLVAETGAVLQAAIHGPSSKVGPGESASLSLSEMSAALPQLRGYEPLLQHFFAEGLFEPAHRRYFRLVDRRGPWRGVLEAEALGPDTEDLVFEKFRRVFDRPGPRSLLERMLAFDSGTLLQALLQVEDRMSMAASIESRVPLLDLEVVRVAARIPGSMKLRHGRSKEVLREALHGSIPAGVADRRDKMGFPVPLREWAAKGPVRDFLHDILLSPRAMTRGFFRRSALEQLLEDPGPAARALWGALNLELWHREFIDASPHAHRP